MTKFRTLQTLLACFALASTISCRAGTKYNYRGRVYDGLTGKPVKDYKIDLTWGDVTIIGRVKDGVFMLSGVPVQSDYSVQIKAAGYREFLSEITERSDRDAGKRTENNDTIENYVAVIFPDSFVAPAAQISVFLDDTTTRPSGKVRLRPRSANGDFGDDYLGTNYTFNSSGATTAERIWHNSLDAFAPSIVQDFSDGVINIANGSTITGVSYAVDVYGVPNYRTAESAAVFIGGAGTGIIKLARISQLDGAPRPVYSNAMVPTITPDGSLTIVFDRSIEIVPTVNTTIAASSLSASLKASADSIVGNVDLKPESKANANERGITFNVTDATFSVKWGGVTNLAPAKTGEIPSSAVCYSTSDLGKISVRAVGGDGTALLINTALVGGRDNLSVATTISAGYICIPFRAPQVAAQ